ncbi:MAG: DUF4276 family protein [Gemmatimonadetes bacterium]|nr:DUF4276 family protein [Gemmatimonadota bacterium]
MNFIVEGQTEETFVNQVLRPHLETFSVGCSARCVETSRKRGRKYRGGITDFKLPRKDINAWMREDKNPDVRFTTMFDLYGLPQDFPGYGDAAGLSNAYERVRVLENALSEDISDRRFVPYIQLHEFESLLFSDLHKLETQFYDRGDEVSRLVMTASAFESPELIDDGKDTSPSKRIIGEIPEYGRMKASAGPIVAGKIGLSVLRSKCRHFGEWIERLEAI